MKYLRSFIFILVCAILLVGCSVDNQSSSNDNNREYEFVIASGGGYNIVANLSPDMVGVIDDNGNWVHELSTSHPFIVDGAIQIPPRHNRPVVVAGGGQPTAEMRRGVRQLNIQMSYRHAEGAIFEKVERTSNVPIVVGNRRYYNYRVIREYDAKSNTLR
ncbi:MAG: hypothetical protein FWE06_06620 [Oscillospiraceae bacterium]|nr:hypothetical protein [Oscillospiraceae bacterium]